MKRLALFLPLLALAAAPARAEGPATNVSAVVKSPIATNGLMRSRNPGARGRALGRYGRREDSPVEAQVRALRWLKSIQREDGSWPEPSAATTALALLAYNSSYNTGFPYESEASCTNGARFLSSAVDENGAFRSGDPGEWTLPVGLVALECWAWTLDAPGAAAIVRAKRRLLDRQRDSGLWGPEDGPDDLWYTWLALRALVGSRAFPEDTVAAASRAADALARAFDAEAGVLRAPDGSADPATRMLPYALELLGAPWGSSAQKALARSLAPVRFSWEGWDGADLPLASASPLRDAAAMHLSSIQIGWRHNRDWISGYSTNRVPHQTVLGTNECDYVDLSGRKRSIGWWDSPSADEFRFCDGGPELPCVRWKDGRRVESTTTLGARIYDTCLMIVPDRVEMHDYQVYHHEIALSGVAVPEVFRTPGNPYRIEPAPAVTRRSNGTVRVTVARRRPDDAPSATNGAPRVLRVGPGKAFKKPSEAAAAARDGDTVVIEAGEWTGDACVWRANDIRIYGAGPDKTILDADGRAAAGKGLWVVQGTNVTIRGVTLRGAKCPDRNGAGIRHEADGALTVEDCRFERNENGFLSGVATNAVLTFERCVFRDNGAGDGLSHNVYAGRAKKLVFRDCASDHAREGHALKSRALVTIVDRCLFDDGDDGRSSYLVDCPNGGRVRIAGCRFVQSPVAPNGTMVSVGEEGGLYPDSALDLRNDANLFENRRASGTEVRSFVPEAKNATHRDR